MTVNRIALSVLVLGLCHSVPAFADSSGKFPGTGSEDAYNKAVDLCNSGVELAKKKEYEKAIALLKQANSIYPHDSGIHQNLGRALRQSGRFSESIPEYKKAIELEPSYLSAWLGLGNSYTSLHNLSEAEKCFRKSVLLKPNSYEANGDLGEVLRDQGKFQEARTFLLKAKACARPDSLAEIQQAIDICDAKEKAARLKGSAK